MVATAEGLPFAKLVDSPTYEMPWDEGIGPQHLTEVGLQDARASVDD